MANWGPFTVEGRNVIVTGGAMGIGFGIVELFVDAGANVLLVDLDAEVADQAARKLAGAPGRIAVLTADVGADGVAHRIVARCVEEFGSLDVLVNNAGIYPQVPMLEMDEDLFDRVYRVNLRGLAFLSKAAGAQFVQQGTGGRIINIASIDSIHPSMVGLAAYDASKGGVLMFTKNFALEMAPHNVTVNAIAPGAIATEGTARPLEGSGMSPEQMQQMMDEFAARIPLARIGSPQDIAGAVAFLASPAGSYATGSMIVVDGGVLLA